MIVLTRRADVIGVLVNRRATTALATIIATVVIGLNGFLLFDTLTG